MVSFFPLLFSSFLFFIFVSSHHPLVLSSVNPLSFSNTLVSTRSPHIAATHIEQHCKNEKERVCANSKDVLSSAPLTFTALYPVLQLFHAISSGSVIIIAVAVDNCGAVETRRVTVPRNNCSPNALCHGPPEQLQSKRVTFLFVFQSDPSPVSPSPSASGSVSRLGPCLSCISSSHSHSPLHCFQDAQEYHSSCQ